MDAGLAGGLTLLLVAGSFFASRDQPAPHRALDGWGIALIVVAAGALAFRRLYPVPVLGVVFAAILGYSVLDYADGPIWLTLVIAYFTAIVLGHRLATAIIGAAGFALFPWLDYLLRDRPAPSPVGLAALAAWLLVLFGVAEGVRIRRERAAEAIRIQEGEAVRRAQEERLRIARELHDTLGHHLSLISVQAGVALHVNAGLPAETRDSLSAIKQASKDGLTELRSVLDILRQEGEQLPRSPTSTLERVEDLVSRARAAGLEVRLEKQREPRPLPFSVDVAAFRIVQEALTNVSRHAGNATATVTLDYRDRDLILRVDDDGRGRAEPGMQGAGKGLVGMRERATALGGELEAGPRPEGGFRVRARLPLDGAE